jgi:hypothetical protein
MMKNIQLHLNQINDYLNKGQPMKGFDFPWADFAPDKWLKKNILSPIEGGIDQAVAFREYWKGLEVYMNEILVPYSIALGYFKGVEKKRMMEESPMDNIRSLIELMSFNSDLSSRGASGSIKAMNDYAENDVSEAFGAFLNTLFYQDGENLNAYFKRKAKLITAMTKDYPDAIENVAPLFGFHFERGEDEKFAETDRFIVYRINSRDKKIKTDMSKKPVLIIPPYVLGANILSFLPDEQRSYTHAFADQSIPTYIRIQKSIDENVGVQTLTGEDDTRDTAYFCDLLKKRHNRMVTLNGYCQGGFSCVCNVLTGELDGLVDALITCVAPIDGTRSKGLADFLKSLPERYNNLLYGAKTLPNGNQVADGKLMGWVYKLKSIEKESPLVSFYRDLVMIKSASKETLHFNNTGLALNYWLKNDRTDIPLGITKMSFASFNIPITKDGVLPVQLFGKKLQFKRIKEKKLPWLICYGEKDDLVESPAALAPMDYIPVETTPFPKGHVAIATSWSHPLSEYPLHGRFGENNRYRGPVRFHMDLE